MYYLRCARQAPPATAASHLELPSPEFLLETNHPELDQQVSIAFIVINTFFIALLFTSRYYNPKAVVMPMLVCNTVCYVLCLGSAIGGILMTQIGGAGYHVDALPFATLEKSLRISKALEFMYTPSVMTSKLALLFLYYHIFEVPIYRRIIIGIGAIIVIQNVLAFILALAICKPFRFFWTHVDDADDGSCGDIMLFYKMYSIPNLATDVAMMVLPWPILAKLKIPWTDKVGLIATFLAASLGIITCTLRFTTFFTTPLLSDPTWYASGGPVIYSLVEPSIYMIANIIPVTRHLYRRARNQARLSAELRTVKSSTGARTNATRSLVNNGNEMAQITIGIPPSEKQSKHNRNSSQVELTIGEFLDCDSDGAWNHKDDVEDQAGYLADSEGASSPIELVQKPAQVRTRE